MHFFSYINYDYGTYIAIILTLLYLQLENIGNFIKAITDYGVKQHDIFEANDLFENTNLTQVQSTLLTLASVVSLCKCFKVVDATTSSLEKKKKSMLSEHRTAEPPWSPNHDSLA